LILILFEIRDEYREGTSTWLHQPLDTIGSQYPIKLDYKAIEQKAKEAGVKSRYYFIGHKTTHKKPLDTNGRQNVGNNIKLCHKFNTCVQLVDGKLYTCIETVYIKYFGNYSAACGDSDNRRNEGAFKP
jgi:hypothetical protein